MLTAVTALSLSFIYMLAIIFSDSISQRQTMLLFSFS